MLKSESNIESQLLRNHCYQKIENFIELLERSEIILIRLNNIYFSYHNRMYIYYNRS